MRLRPTATGAAVGLCSCALLALGQARHLPLLVGVGVIGMVLVAGAMLEAAMAPALEMSFETREQTVERGRRADLTLAVTNVGRRRVRTCVVTGSVPVDRP